MGAGQEFFSTMGEERFHLCNGESLRLKQMAKLSSFVNSDMTKGVLDYALQKESGKFISSYGFHIFNSYFATALLLLMRAISAFCFFKSVHLN